MLKRFHHLSLSELLDFWEYFLQQSEIKTTSSLQNMIFLILSMSYIAGVNIKNPCCWLLFVKGST